ncbi:unnamed protein product [Cyprideis torosa]|uniref:Uncharacterized protein n=1 Tax=Cyprideis torosa TaxID=163714 RepID=A0A7R8ZG79_9CRUS|nr:unnamed protein product [Cyprideis torosa]CAG0879450.1 unnamed protein product [Cyprideis torosa]
MRCKVRLKYHPALLCLLPQVIFQVVLGSLQAKRLYDDLLSTYNRLIRPVGNNTDVLTVKMGLKLSQLIDVNLKNQIVTTNVWVEQEWNDYKMAWDPEEYGGVTTLYVPSDSIWLPDIVLYNNADGNYEVTIMTKAILHHTGTVTWKPPAIYKSACDMEVEFFPFDEQSCFLKFGSWTYDGYLIDLRHIKQADDNDEIPEGIDLQDYYISVEWDIMSVPAARHERYYPCCSEPYPDIYFWINIRRKTLFYTVNLIIPCVGISFLSVLVFYLPSDSGEKVSLCISILLSLTVFFLLLAEIIPPTSLRVPLLGKYLLFTMTLVTFSVMATIGVLNVNFRSPATHRMAPWVKKVFIDFLPPYLFMQRPSAEEHKRRLSIELLEADRFEKSFNRFDSRLDSLAVSRIDSGHFTFSLPHEEIFSGTTATPALPDLNHQTTTGSSIGNSNLPPEVERTTSSVQFIAQHMKNMDRYSNIEEDWKYIAMVLDRLFLWIFTLACVIGTAGIILQAPSLWDKRRPIDVLRSKLALAKARRMIEEDDMET